MGDFAVYAGLFAAAFVAATILPAQSEALLVGLILAGRYPPEILVAVATLANVIGSIVNWLLGRGVERFKDRKWFPVGEPMLERAKGWYHQYGRWSLLLSWVPVIGDPITVVAGIMREPLSTFVVLVVIAKLTRYVVVAAVTLHLVG